MSDNWLQIIPTIPAFQPSLDAAEKAKTLMGSFVPLAEEVVFEFKDNVEFIHPGCNWSGVKCTACGADAEPWWQDAMDSSFKNAFVDLTITTPCCGACLSLNDLNYIWPAGFARFVLEAMNPNTEDLTPVQLRELSDCLGCDVRRIWVHI